MRDVLSKKRSTHILQWLSKKTEEKDKMIIVNNPSYISGWWDLPIHAENAGANKYAMFEVFEPWALPLKIKKMEK